MLLLLLSYLPLNTQVTTEQSSSHLSSCPTTNIPRISVNVVCRHSRSGSKKNAIATTATCFIRHGKWLGYHFFLLTVQHLQNPPDMKVVELQLHPLPSKIQIPLAHLPGKLPLRGGKERYVYVWRPTRIIVLKLFLKTQGFKVSILRLEHNRKT